MGLGAAGGTSYWAANLQWGPLPIFLAALGSFVAVLWAWNGILWIKDREGPSRAALAHTYAWGLHQIGVLAVLDQTNPDAYLQIQLSLHNATSKPLKYDVQEYTVQIDGRSSRNPIWENHGSILPPNASHTFNTQPYSKAEIGELSTDVVTKSGTLHYRILYGHPDYGVFRMAEKRLTLQLRFVRNPANPQQIAVISTTTPNHETDVPRNQSFPAKISQTLNVLAGQR